MTTSAASPSILTAVCGALGEAIALDAGKAPKTIQLFAIGSHKPRNGNPAILSIADRATADQVAHASAAYWGGADPMVDYDHQSILGPGKAVSAPASGWMKRIFATDAGVFADVEWTAKASAQIEALEYRYISPVVRHTADGRVTQIVNAALTNTPNLDLMALNSALNGPVISTEEDDAPMSFKAIASALGLADTADETAIIAAIAPLKAQGAALTATASALGVEIKDGVELTAIASAATALKTAADAAEPDPAKFVKKEHFTALQSEVTTLNTAVQGFETAAMTAMKDEAQKEGRLTPALRTYADDTFKDKLSLQSYLATLPATSLGTTIGKPAVKVDADAALTADQLAVCSAIGVSPEDFKKTLIEEAS